MHGNGTLVYPDGHVYEGGFIDNVPNGHGVLTRRGNKTEGKWQVRRRMTRRCWWGAREGGRWKKGGEKREVGSGGGRVVSPEWSSGREADRKVGRETSDTQGLSRAGRSRS